MVAFFPMKHQPKKYTCDSDSGTSITYDKDRRKPPRVLKYKSWFLNGRFPTNATPAKEMGFGFGFRALDNL